jgi:hypothetical protein
MCDVEYEQDQNVPIKMGPSSVDKPSGRRLYLCCIPCWHAWHTEWQSDPCADAECCAFYELFAERNPMRIAVSGGLGALALLPLAPTLPPPAPTLLTVDQARIQELESMVAQLELRVSALETSSPTSKAMVAQLELRVIALETSSPSSAASAATVP